MATNYNDRDNRDQNKTGTGESGNSGNQGGTSNAYRSASSNGGRMISEGSSNRRNSSNVNEWNRDEGHSMNDEF